MKGNRSEMNLEELKNQYSKELENLEHLLSRGATWSEINKHRSNISDLSLEIYHKLYSNPIEERLRNS